MIIKTKQTRSEILREGEHSPTLNSVKGLPTDADPKKVSFGFKFPGHEGEITKELPLSFEEGAPLRKDVETLLGKGLTAKEAAEGINLNDLVGKPCRVVVMHKAGAGGKPKAVVTVIMPPATAPAPAAAS
jgi:hypothetical protein